MALPNAFLSIRRILTRHKTPTVAFLRRNQDLGFEEPEYLDALLPQQPVYSLLNVQMKSYDFPVLERFGSYVHRTAENMGLTVEERIIQVTTFKHMSKAVDDKYKLPLYERNVQISDFPCTMAPVFLEVVRSSLPEGMQLSVHPHEDAHEEIRYIPDLELIDLKSQLEDMSQKKK